MVPLSRRSPPGMSGPHQGRVAHPRRQSGTECRRLRSSTRAAPETTERSRCATARPPNGTTPCSDRGFQVERPRSPPVGRPTGSWTPAAKGGSEQARSIPLIPHPTATHNRSRQGPRTEPVRGPRHLACGEPQASDFSPRLKILLPSHTSGSYLRSTTRSLSGISALSVMWMCSGHTSVQHLVMLHIPRPCSSWAAR